MCFRMKFVLSEDLSNIFYLRKIWTTIVHYIQIDLNEVCLFVGADNVDLNIRILADSFSQQITFDVDFFSTIQYFKKYNS